jgi:hypothetical protein
MRQWVSSKTSTVAQRGAKNRNSESDKRSLNITEGRLTQSFKPSPGCLPQMPQVLSAARICYRAITHEGASHRNTRPSRCARNARSGEESGRLEASRGKKWVESPRCDESISWPSCFRGSFSENTCPTAKCEQGFGTSESACPPSSDDDDASAASPPTSFNTMYRTCT